MTNKIFVSEYKGENQFKGKSHFVIIIAASSSEIAEAYIKEKIGINIKPTLLLNAEYPTIYTSNGSRPEANQAKILFNSSLNTDFD
jgi:hypothetical protein